jgi:hydrogenase expression/formation protein HypC
MCLAIPGKIVEIIETDDSSRTAKVSFGGALKNIDLSLVPEAKKGDYVLVHVGFALNIIDEEEAKNTLDYLNQIGDTE